MIQIEFEGARQLVTPTIFPDKTSQVWKLELDEYKGNEVDIIWNWEQENELIWINQLICLLYQSNVTIRDLHMPYLPYGRQDKDVSNTSTFAKHVFLEVLLKEHVGQLSTLDAHSEHPSIVSRSPLFQIDRAVKHFGPDVIVFPDKGAYTRYAAMFDSEHYATIVLDKVRNQQTGKIEDLAINTNLTTFDVAIASYTRPINLLIVDDISDYGGTFKKAAKFLNGEYGINNIGLYVTHFLGHGGIESFNEAGISKIYTTNSLTPYRKNDDGIIIV